MSVTNYLFSGGQNGGQSPHFGSISVLRWANWWAVSYPIFAFNSPPQQVSCWFNKQIGGGQPLLPPPLFQQLWSKHGKTHSKTGYCLQQSRPKKYSDGEGLYFCVCKQGSPYWMIRYTTAKGRREATLGQFPLMSFADARIAAAYFRKEVRDGIDPLLEKQKIELPGIEKITALPLPTIPWCTWSSCFDMR